MNWKHANTCFCQYHYESLGACLSVKPSKIHAIATRTWWTASWLLQTSTDTTNQISWHGYCVCDHIKVWNLWKTMKRKPKFCKIIMFVCTTNEIPVIAVLTLKFFNLAFFERERIHIQTLRVSLFSTTSDGENKSTPVNWRIWQICKQWTSCPSSGSWKELL